MYAQLSIPRIAGSAAKAEAFQLPPMNKIHHRMDRFWDDYIAAYDQPSSSLERSVGQMFRPHMDAFEDEAAYYFEAELPGLRQSDFSIEVANKTLILRGEKHDHNGRRERRTLRCERTYGSFQRIEVLPIDADLENIEANLENGVLTVTVMKEPSRHAVSQKIKIQKAA